MACGGCAVCARCVAGREVGATSLVGRQRAVTPQDRVCDRLPRGFAARVACCRQRVLVVSSVACGTEEA
eukprot:4303912-Prymnesium_polylepis.2